jgi:hypothetical protein
MSARPIDVYVNDHFAGATFGRDLSHRLASDARDAELRAAMEQLAEEIAADREALEHLIGRIGAEPNKLLAAGGALVEKASRLVTGKGTGDGDLGDFEAIEALSLGVEGKRCLWTALIAVREQYPGLNEVDLDDLQARAERQRGTLEELRGAAAKRALAAAAPVG